MLLLSISFCVCVCVCYPSKGLQDRTTFKKKKRIFDFKFIFLGLIELELLK